MDPAPYPLSTSVPSGFWSWQEKDAMAEGKADSAFLPSSSHCPRLPHMTLWITVCVRALCFSQGMVVSLPVILVYAFACTNIFLNLKML